MSSFFSHETTKARRLAGFALLLVFLFGCGAAHAGQASATASLSANQIAVGDEVELQITVEGAQNIERPQLRVDGLDIHHMGNSTQIQMNNFDVTRSVKLTYSVVARREGTFTIPALTLNAGGKKLTTNPLTLSVAATGSRGNRNPAGASQGAQEADSKFAFAQWVLPKTTLYVGEAVPAELWLYVDKRVQCQLQQVVAKADGFSISLQKMDRLQQRDVTKDGREMILAVIKAAITPVKTGSLTLPPAEISAVAVLPQKRSRPQRLPGGFGSLFDDPFFNQAFNVPQQIVIRPDPVEMEVKPLPAAGKPRDFSGAVGQFTMETKTAPLRVKTGDPVTLTAVVKGIGSFDRMNAPAVADTPGWRSYPPSGKFQADDAVGISGEKTFECALIPETPQTEGPAVTFSYFNPSTEKYETLKGEPLAVTVEGAVLPASPTTALAPAMPAPSAAAAATPASAASDIQYLRTDFGRASAGFDPAWQTKPFWVAQALAACAFVAFGGAQWWRCRNQDGRRQRIARLNREKQSALAVLRQEGTAAQEFFTAAIRFIQIETALSPRFERLEPGAVDTETACSSRELSCETIEGVRRLFAAHDELRYAGSGAAATAVAPDQRSRVLQILEAFETCHV